MTAKDWTARPGARDLGWLLALAIGAVWLAAVLLWASVSPFTIDGYIYHAMIDAAARNGSLFFDNGYAETGMEGLRIFLSVTHDGALTGQYPGGWGFIAAPAYLLGGLHGVMVLNVLAATATLLLVWRLAWLFFQDGRVAFAAVAIYGLGSFAVDYAIAIWPHSPATLTVAAAVTAVAAGWRNPQRAAFWAAAAGLAIGAGLNIRVDVLFPAAGLVAWILMTGPRPYRDAGAFALGLIPGFAAAMAVNWVKFGSPSPMNYGSSSGTTTTFAAYLDFIPLAVAGALAVLLMGAPPIRRLVYRPVVAAALAGLVIIVAAALTPLREIALTALQGFWILIVDFQAHPLPSRGLVVDEDGVLRAFRLLKKSLLQNAPFLAVLAALIPLAFRGQRVVFGCIALVAAATIAPFAVKAWHGGASSSMRYFLHMWPVLAVGAAAAMVSLRDRAGRPLFGLAIGAALALTLCLVGAGLSGLSFLLYWQIELPLALAAATAVLAIAAFAPGGGGRLAAYAAHSAAAAGVIVAAATAWGLDARSTEGHRGYNLRYVEQTAKAPDDALIVTYLPKLVAMRLNQPNARMAQVFKLDLAEGEAFKAVLAAAWAEDRPVWVIGDPLTDRIIEAGLASSAAPRYGPEANVQINVLAPPDAKAKTDG